MKSMSKKIHSLKIESIYFTHIEWGIKTFEIRYNDRNFQLGDILKLCEYCNGECTGEETLKEIIYITNYEQKDGFVVLGTRDLQS